MSSHQISLVPPRSLGSGMNSQLLFHDEQFVLPTEAASKPHCRVGDPPQTRDLGGFLDDKLFSLHRNRYFTAAAPEGSEFRHGIFADASTRPRDRTPSCDGSDEDDDYDNDEIEKDCEEENGDEVEGFVPSNNPNCDKSVITNCRDNVHNSAPGNLNGLDGKHNSSFDFNKEVLVEDNSFVPSANSVPSARATENHHHQQQQCRAITVAEPQEGYHLQFLQGREGLASRQKEFAIDNDCSFSGRKKFAYSTEAGESLRAILSDSLTGSLMDDAMILRCGHSFGSIGMQHVLRMKACFTCSEPVTENSVVPNHLLRAACKAFRREDASMFCRSSKKRKDKGSYGEAYDHPRGRGVHFPLAVADHVIIKGNKRTPERFVGREAIVTTQCLNGWYVVKTLDSAESVKVQYSSLAKMDKSKQCKTTTNWL